MPRDRGINLPLFIGQPPGHDRMVTLVHFAVLELFGEAKVGGVVLGRDDAAACVHVEPVNDPRAHHAADPAQAAGAVVQQRIDQRAALVAVARMGRHSGRLVDHDQVVVLEQHLQRQLLRPGLDLLRNRPGDLHRLPRDRMLRWLGRFAVH